MSYSSVLVTFPDLQTAKKIATAAVDQRLAACANLLPVESIYRWQGEIVDEQETAALFKIRLLIFRSSGSLSLNSILMKCPASCAMKLLKAMPNT